MQPTSDSTAPGPPVLDPEIARSWPVAMFIGIVTLVIGVIVIAWPSQTLTVLAVLLGIQLLLFGLYRLIHAFSSDVRSTGLMAFVGILGMVAGVIVLRNPFETVAVLATLLGVVWIVGGAIELMTAIVDGSADNRWFMVFSGLLSIAAGVLVVAWPAPTLTVIAWIAGLYLVFAGILVCITAFKLRSLAD
ncbi:MAG: HdeD family acid-resistance protein [Acidimicrobiales bacterium]